VDWCGSRDRVGSNGFSHHPTTISYPTSAAAIVFFCFIALVSAPSPEACLPNDVELHQGLSPKLTLELARNTRFENASILFPHAIRYLPPPLLSPSSHTTSIPRQPPRHHSPLSAFLLPRINTKAVSPFSSSRCPVIRCNTPLP
jgi:hypothetical protein